MRKRRSASPSLSRSTRRRRLLAAAALGLVLPLTVDHVAFADGAVDVSVTGNADGDVVAVSGTGSAQSSGGVAVSGTGNAYGGIAGMSVVGDSQGGVAAIDPDATIGSGSRTAYGAAGIHHFGLNQIESAYQATLVADAPPPSDAELAERAQLVSDLTPSVAVNLVTGLHQTGRTVFFMSTHSLQVQYPSGCVPQTVYSTYHHRGMPSMHQLYAEMGTAQANGTTMDTAIATIRRHWKGTATQRPILDRVHDAVDLLVKAKGSITKFGQGVIIEVYPTMMWSWQGGGTGNNHVVQIWMVSEDDGGLLFIADGGDNQKNPGHPGAGYGTYEYRLNDLYMAMPHDGEIIW